MRKIMLTVLAGTALTLVACGSDKSATSDPYAAPPPAATTTTPSTATTVAVKTATTPLGQILVSPTGRTLYAFTKDVNAQSSCTGACAATWPPVLVTGDVTVDGNLSGSLFSVIDPTRRHQATRGRQVAAVHLLGRWRSWRHQRPRLWRLLVRRRNPGQSRQGLIVVVGHRSEGPAGRSALRARRRFAPPRTGRRRAIR